MFPQLNQSVAPSVQGQSAAANGKGHEARIEMFLKGYGYRKEDDIFSRQGPYYVRQAKNPDEWKSIFQSTMVIDFYVFHQEKYPHGLGIECKTQQQSGTVDHKLVYAVESLKGLPMPTILLLEGNGANRGAINWCSSQSDDKFMFIHGFSNFQKLAQQGLL